MTFGGELQKARERLGPHLAFEAEELVLAAYRQTSSGAATLTRLDLYLKSQEEFPASASRKLQELMEQRVSGRSLQYLTGVQAFLDHDYQVAPGVLIPRPETEILSRASIEYLTRAPSKPTLGIEVGLGSGILSIELLSKFPGLTILGSEISAAAQQLAATNAKALLGDSAFRLKVVVPPSDQDVLGSLKAELGTAKADFLISNPPYLLQSEAEADVIQNEPHEALFAPPGRPCFYYEEIAKGAYSMLRLGGYLFLELPHERAREIQKIFMTLGCWETEILLDLTQRERVLVAWTKSK